MWERLELFWLAFEKFALFFSFVGTLAGLTVALLVYGTLVEMQSTPRMATATPAPTPPIDLMIGAMHGGFVKIQGAVSPVMVPISHTVPITLDIRINPDQVELKLLEKGEVKTGKVVINLDDAGKLVGKDATIEMPEGSTFRVGLDVSRQVVFNVPVEVVVPIQVPSNVDLRPEIDALRAISTTAAGEPLALPQAAGQAP